jgi:mannose-6-phosphate isomerase-like protein (cupin superfamily)
MENKKMSRGTIISISKVKPFVFSNMYESRMLLDDKNSESKKIHLNHGTLKVGGKMPYGSHGTKEDPYDEVYIILKGKCKLLLDDELFDVKAGDIVFIPGGVKHALDNTKGIENLELITIWGRTPPRGINGVYDLRLERWGVSYKTIDE